MDVVTVILGFLLLLLCLTTEAASIEKDSNSSLAPFLEERTPSELQFDCSNRPDGAYPDYQRACRIFYVCHASVLHVFWCLNGTVFNPESGHCDAPARSRCLNPDRVSGWLPLQTTAECADLQDGVYADYASGCQGFYFCNGGMKTPFSCPGKTLFDWQTGFCRPSALVSCESLSCEGRTEGYHADAQSGCKRYLLCAQGRKAEYVCPPGLVFSQKLLRCSDPRNVRCRPRPDDDYFNCYGLPDGYYPDYSTGCRSFHYCHANRAKQYSCPTTLVFNRKLLTCDQPWKSQCDKSSSLCSAKPNGVYPKFETDCREFSVCRNGLLHQSGACAQGKVLNPVTGLCQPKGLVTCAPVRDPDCDSRPDGMYPDIGTGCSAFYVCLSGRRVLTSYCSGKNYLFDIATRSCLPSPLVWCNASAIESHTIEPAIVREYDCQGRLGIYPDFGSGCTGYIICAHRRTDFGVCPPGYRFDSLISSCQATEDVATCLAPLQLGTFRCLPGDDGIFPDYASGCRRWHECFENRGSTFACPEEQVFDPFKRMCSNADGFVCNPDIGQISRTSPNVLSPIEISSFDCQTRTNGIFDDPNNCGTFHICAQNIRHSFQCPQNHSFNSKRQACVAVEIVECFKDIVSGESQEDVFACRERLNGMYPDTNCKRYWICEGGHTTTAYCPQGELFNIFTMVCEPASKVHCLGLTTTTIPPPTVASPTIVEDVSPNSLTSDIQCPNGAAGFYPDYESGCKKFHICFRAIRRSYSCPSVLLFNPDTKNCDLPDNVDCRKPELSVNRGRYNCTRKAPGYYTDFSSGCKQYFACTENDAFVYSCPSGRLFNSETLVCDLESSVNCQDPGESEDRTKTNITGLQTDAHAHGVPKRFMFQCMNKSDGFYPDYARHCHVFYRCIRGKKFSHYCKPGLLFNPKVGICDFEENVVCTPPEKN